MAKTNIKNFETLDFAPVTQEALTPEQYLRMPDSQRENIESVKVEPPSLGKSNFGRVIVSYSDPIYTINPSSNSYEF